MTPKPLPEIPSDIPQRERKRDRKGGALFKWLSRSGKPSIPKGIDWSSPMSAFRSGWTILAYAPQTTLLRIAIAMAVGVHGMILGASIMASREGDHPEGEVSFVSRVNARDQAGISLGGRKPMDALLTGYRNILGDGPMVTGDNDSLGKGTNGAGADGEGSEDEGVDGAGEDGTGTDEDAASEDIAGNAMAEALKAAQAGGGKLSLAKGGIGALSTSIGGGGTSASLKTGGSSASGSRAGKNGSSTRSKENVRQGGKMAKHAAARKGSLRQLQSANTLSRKGLGAKTNEGAFTAASDAFEGQTSPGGAGTSITGEGAGLGGADSLGSPPSGGGGAPLDSKNVDIKQCPPNYYLRGEECNYIPSGSAMPQTLQNMIENAKEYLIAAAVLIVAGLLLLLKVPHPAAKVIGAIMLVAGAGLVALSVVIGNQVQDKANQDLQGNIILEDGQNVLGGGAVRSGSSSLDQLQNKGGANGNFGFDR